MTLSTLAAIQAKEIFPGFHGKFIHGDNVTIAHWEIEAGAALPEHAHPHEQVTMVTAGEFEIVVKGEKHVLRPGSVITIPGNVAHSGTALAACRIIDVFHPRREDYR